MEHSGLILEIATQGAAKPVLKQEHLIMLVNTINKVPIQVHYKGSYIKHLYQDA